MEKSSLILSLYEIGAIQFGEYQLKSGQTSSVYINLRKIISYPDLLRQVAAVIGKATQDCNYQLVCGVPYTALPIATCLSLTQQVPMIMRRKEKKNYGTKQSIEGEFKTGQTVLIIEDIITTGSSIIETAEDITNCGLIVHDVIALIDREQGGKTRLSQVYRTHTILNLTEILETLLSSGRLVESEKIFAKSFLANRNLS
jgi:uridine monophosphate synthetase